MKIYAYLPSSRPIVATDVPAHVQVLSSDCAVLVPPAPDRLADGMLQLVNDGELANRLGESGTRRWHRHYGRTAYGTALLTAYKSLRTGAWGGAATGGAARSPRAPEHAGGPPPLALRPASAVVGDPGRYQRLIP